MNQWRMCLKLLSFALEPDVQVVLSRTVGSNWNRSA